MANMELILLSMGGSKREELCRVGGGRFWGIDDPAGGGARGVPLSCVIKLSDR